MRLGHGAYHRRSMTDAQADAMLNAVLDSGINFIDTSAKTAKQPSEGLYPSTCLTAQITSAPRAGDIATTRQMKYDLAHAHTYRSLRRRGRAGARSVRLG